MKATKSSLHICSCSWKYDSWRGIVYSDAKEKNFLREYSQHFSTVEVDQWFWSLFAGDKVVLPKPKVVKEYADSVPEDFIFSIKVPNSITLTHHYKKQISDSLQVNPHFLSIDVMKRFLELLEPLGDRIGPLNFQFEYLNKQKMGGVGGSLSKSSENLCVSCSGCENRIMVNWIVISHRKCIFGNHHRS